MAYESWAGGTISSGADATSQSLKPRGGYISVGDIPNVPKLVDMPMINNYPKVPNIRYEQVPGQVDMQSRAAKLMQKELPSSFEEAGNIRTAAAGRGQMAMGKAIESAGADIGKAFGTASEVMSKLAGASAKSKDNADQDRFKIASNLADQRLDEMYKTTDMDQWDAKAKEIRDQFFKSTENLGVNQFTKDNIQTMRGAWEESRLTYGHENRKKLKSLELDHDLAASEFNDGLSQKNWAMATRGADLMHKNNEISDDQHKQMIGKIQFAQGMEMVETAKQNPGTAQGLADDAERVLKGEKAKSFQILNDNPGIVPNLLVEAKAAVKVHRRNGINAISEGISTGEVKSDEDIDKIAKEYKLPDEVVNRFKQTWKSENAPYIPGNHVAMRDQINKFEAETDVDGMKEFEIRSNINTMIDKDSRSRFTSLLDQKIKDVDKPKDAVTIDHKDTLEKIAERDKQGLLVPVGMQNDLLAWRARDKALKDEIAEASKRVTGGESLSKRIEEIRKRPEFQFTGAEEKAVHANGAAVNDHILKADKWKKDNPDAKPGEMQEAILGEKSEAYKVTEKNAGTAVPRATAVPLGQTSGVTRQQFSEAERRGPPKLAPQGDYGYPSLDGGANTPAYPSAPGMTPPPPPPGTVAPSHPVTQGNAAPNSIPAPAHSQRQEIMAELDRDPRARQLTMQMLDTEGGGVATMEALVNRVAMIRQKVPGWTIWDELNSGFYGPINRGYAQTVKIDAARAARYSKDIALVRAGSNLIRGRTDQGYQGDPNWQGPGRVKVTSNPKEIYNFWVGNRRGAQFNHSDSARFAGQYG